MYLAEAQRTKGKKGTGIWREDPISGMKRPGRWVFTGLAVVSLAGLAAWVWLWMSLSPLQGEDFWRVDGGRYDIIAKNAGNSRIEIVGFPLTSDFGPWFIFRFSFWLPIDLALAIWIFALWFFVRSRPRLASRRSLGMTMLGGLAAGSLLMLMLTANFWVSPPSGSLQVVNALGSETVLDFGVVEYDDYWSDSRLGHFLGTAGQPLHFNGSSIPLWLAIVITGAPPILWIIMRAIRRRKFAPGHCVRCGYDLRATPARCPECGALAGDL
jgi:hypothetical protein